MIEIITGNIFDAKEKYICHQCNCLTQDIARLAKDMFTHYPYADVYTGRIKPNIPGTIDVKGNGLDQRYVVNIFGQYYPGEPKDALSELDGYFAREKHFYRALLRISKIPNLESIAFPWKIGCGSAGGDWQAYLGNITNFEKYVKTNYNVKVIIYKFK